MIPGDAAPPRDRGTRRAVGGVCSAGDAENPLTPPPRTALVTGGTGGISAAVALALAQRGHRLLVTGRDPARGDIVERQLRGAPAATFLPSDHSSIAATRALVEAVRPTSGVLDVLVLYAGAMPSQRASTPEGLDVEIAIDVVGPVVLVDALLPLLTARPGARVVLVTSAAADRAPADTTADP